MIDVTRIFDAETLADWLRIIRQWEDTKPFPTEDEQEWLVQLQVVFAAKLRGHALDLETLRFWRSTLQGSGSDGTPGIPPQPTGQSGSDTIPDDADAPQAATDSEAETSDVSEAAPILTPVKKKKRGQGCMLFFIGIAMVALFRLGTEAYSSEAEMIQYYGLLFGALVLALIASQVHKFFKLPGDSTDESSLEASEKRKNE